MKVSVCIATYNGGKYIREQLESILCQLDVNDEIVISDDSSTDCTIKIIESFGDNRIRLFTNQAFHSPICNFENAIGQATGDYIFLCDQDDIWLPSKMERMLFYLSKYDLVVSDCKVVDKNLNIVEQSFFSVMTSGRGRWKNFFKNTYLGCCMAFKKEILNYVLPFPKKIAMHDIWIGLSVEWSGRSFFLNEPLMLYRRHGENASFGGGKSQYSLFYRIQYRFQMLYFLCQRKYLKR